MNKPVATASRRHLFWFGLAAIVAIALAAAAFGVRWRHLHPADPASVADTGAPATSTSAATSTAPPAPEPNPPAADNKPIAAKPADATAVPLEFAADETTRLTTTTLGRDLYVTGTLDAVARATLRAKVSGEVRQLPVREGDRVAAGQLLARIDTTEQEARVAQAAGLVETARANHALANRNRATNAELLQQGFISKNAFDSISSGFDANVGQLKSAEAALAVERSRLADARVVAPFAGIVARRSVQAGEKVAFDAPIVSIVDLRQLELQTFVPADDVPKLKVGADAQLKVEGYDAREFTGRVTRIAPATEPGTRSVLALVAVDNRDEALKAGMFATARVAIERSAPVPTLPTGAIQTAAGGHPTVWVLADGKLARRPVKLGRRDEAAGRVEVLDGLAPDDVVLAARFDKLREGAPAIVAPDQSTR